MAAFAALGGGALSAAGQAIGSYQQAKASKAAIHQTHADLMAAQAMAGGAAQGSRDRLGNAVQDISTQQGQGFLGAQDYLSQGLGQQRRDILQSGDMGANALTGGTSGALASIYNGAGQGVGYLGQAQQGVDTAVNSGMQAAGGILANRQDRAGALLDQPGGLYGGYQQSPGYQFAQQQGEQAIARQNAASGGRYSGAALKEMAQFNQGLAKQDYQNYVQNQNSLYGANSNSDAQSLQAGSQLANIYAQGASQLGSAQQSLGSQAATMAYGTGQAAGGMQYGAGGQLADIYGRTGTQLGSQAAGAGGALAGNTANYYGAQGNLGWNAVTQGNAYDMQAAGVPAQLAGVSAQNNQSGVQYAGGAGAAVANLGNGIATWGMLSNAHGGGNQAAPSEYDPAMQYA